MRILIFETNLVFANLVKRVLLETWQADVDIVSDYHVLLSRLQEEKYHFIIADILSSQSMDLLLTELRRVRTAGTIIFTWGITNKNTRLNLERTAVLYPKPAPTPENLKLILGQFVSASGTYTQLS